MGGEIRDKVDDLVRFTKACPYALSPWMAAMTAFVT
jgi:hypothetical protein